MTDRNGSTRTNKLNTHPKLTEIERERSTRAPNLWRCDGGLMAKPIFGQTPLNYAVVNFVVSQGVVPGGVGNCA